MILHIAYGKKLKTWQQRTQAAKNSDVLKKFPEKCQAVLNALLEKYTANGVNELENLQVLRNTPFDSIGSPPNIVKLFGGKEGYLRAVRDLEDSIYEVA